MGLQMLEIVMAIEDHFGVVIPDQRASQIVTIEDMQDEVVRLLVAQGGRESPELRRQVLAGIVAITSKQMEIDASLIKPESKWVGDITTDG